MKTRFITICIASILCALHSCNTDSKQPQAQTDTTKQQTQIPRAATPLTFVKSVFELHYPKRTDTTDAWLQIEYLEAKGGSDSMRNKINAAIKQMITQQARDIFPERKLPANCTFQQCTDALFNEYTADISQSGQRGFTSQWSAEYSLSLVEQTTDVAVFQLINSSYLGGAHPNTYCTYATFSLRTGSLLAPETFIADTTALKKVAEEFFRKERELSPTASLQEEGFFWDSVFVLPQEMALGAKGLYLYYNPYEVAAYAMGPTEFMIPRERLQGILRKGY